MSSASTWLDLPDDHPFGLANLPYGVFSTTAGPRVGVRIGDWVLDAGAVAQIGKDAWESAMGRISLRRGRTRASTPSSSSADRHGPSPGTG